MPKSNKKIGKGLPVIKCSCGTEILLVPNVKLMNEAIEAHIIEHTKNCKTQKEAEDEAECIRDDLIIQILEKASKM